MVTLLGPLAPTSVESDKPVTPWPVEERMMGAGPDDHLDDDGTRRTSCWLARPIPLVSRAGST
jgi:hypothetical protein